MSAIKPISNDHSGEWHIARFLEFARAKAAIGEPTPHMRVVSYLSEGLTEEERLWRVGAYLAAYSVITGEAIWTAWPYASALRGQRRLCGWLKENWAGVHTRKPRRCVRTPGKFARCLTSYLGWMSAEFPRLMRMKDQLAAQEEYDAWWDSATAIPFFGRYIAIRLLEVMRRYGYMDAHLYDIRAVGAHSPIRCLMLLRPDAVEELSTGEPDIVNRVGGEVLDILRSTGIDMSWFTYATLLCEYRGGYEDGGDYAGNQHDEELEYSLSRYAEHWSSVGMTSRLYEARAAIDPHECLGEIQGWSKRRTDVAGWMRQRGIVWSDILYDYKASIEAGEPIARG